MNDPDLDALTKILRTDFVNEYELRDAYVLARKVVPQLLEERVQNQLAAKSWERMWWLSASEGEAELQEKLAQALFEAGRWKRMYELKSSEQDLLSQIITKLEALNPQEAEDATA